jgi:hypothetical protein
MLLFADHLQISHLSVLVLEVVVPVSKLVKLVEFAFELVRKLLFLVIGLKQTIL